jgi:hypothetical protein
MTTTPTSRPDVSEPEESIELRYDGPDYQGEMPAREVSTVLAAQSDFVQAVSHDLGHPTAPGIKVKAFQEGSFEISMILEIVKVAGGSLAGAAGIGTAFRFYWKNMRRVVSDYVHLPERGVFRVTWMDGEVSELTEGEWRLYQNKRAKKAMRGIVAPLRSGATRMDFKAGSEVAEVPAADAPMFELPAREGVDVRRFNAWAEPDTVRFDPDKKWGLVSRDLGSFSATIEDPSFLGSVETGRTTVGKTDAFFLALRLEVSEVGGSVRRSYFIERVIEHHRGGRQDALPSEPGDDA